ncbi:MAG: trimethylamine methyltransferase family protein [Anaerolineales bacterium]|nr:trimethylamine methyltransferase family protein [Anaerolineales bacterium]
MIHLTVLSGDEVEAIHQSTLRILSETGVRLASPQGREILLGAGAHLQDERLLLPPDLVEGQVAKCTKQVKLRGRGGALKTLGDGKLYWHNLGGARDIYDHRSGKRRGALLQDVRDATRLLDALEHATTITPFFTPQDVPGPLMSLAMYRHALPHTIKPLQGPGVQTAAEVRFAARMAAVVGPPSEVLSLSVSPVSPLLFPDETAGAIIEIAQHGIPFGPLPCPTAGTTAPLSLAGALAQQNAEVLASIVIAQLVHPGLPVVYCGRLAMMEPRTGVSVWGGIELGLVSAATVQLGHRYGLPVNVYGFSTNAHVLDVQNGFERALNAAIPALAGADELSGIGEMEAGVSSSFAQMVCDNELAASVHRLCRGIAVDEDALGVEVIAAVMRGAHNFLGQKHTTRYLRSGEVFVTKLAERGAWEAWEREGRQGMAERAQAEAERLLAEHQVPPLSDDQERELDEIMIEAERELVG